jgi:DNA repair exonuclease SbcCD ATPase subunit
MTKQIKLKDGKILKIERCGKCLVKPTSILGFCPLSNKPVYAGHSIRDDCPLEEWQEPTTNKESTKVETAAPTKEQGISTCMAAKLAGSCPVCPQYLTCPDPGKAVIIPPERDIRWDALEANIKKMGAALAEKDAEIVHIKDEIEKRNAIIQGYYVDIVRLKELVENRERGQEYQNVDIINLEEKIKKKDIEIARLINDKSLCIQELDRFKKKYDERVMEVMRLNDRIAQKDRELKDLGEALREKQVALADLKSSFERRRY